MASDALAATSFLESSSALATITFAKSCTTQRGTEPWRIAGLRKGDSSQRERKGCTNPADLPEYLTGSGCQRERKGPSQPWKPQPARTQGLQATRGLLPKEQQPARTQGLQGTNGKANARRKGSNQEITRPKTKSLKIK